MHRTCTRTQDGFSLLEVLIALLLLAGVAGATAHVFVVVLGSVRDAREETTATLLAVQKIESCQGAPWGSPALGSSPATALDTDIAGFSDLVDARGRTIGGSTPASELGTYVRRWSIQPLADPSVVGVVVRVFVTAQRRARRMAVASGAADGEVLLTDVRTIW